MFLSSLTRKSKLIFMHNIAFSSGKYASTSSIGFIGLGNMGKNMAKNLLDKGHKLMVYDVYPEAMTQLVDSGASAGQSPADLAEKCNKIITMLPSSPHVQEVCTAKNGIFQCVKPDTILIDCSTIDPTVTKDLANMAEKRNAIMLDAPVSGGVIAAKGGTLTFMVGGKQNKVDAIKDLLMCMGQNVVHCGENGTGQAAKICNNMALAISMIGTSEAMNLAIRLGLDPKKMADIMNTSSGRCWSSDTYNPVPGVMKNVPSANEYQGGFGTALMAKDLGLAQLAAAKTSSPIPLGSLAHQVYRVMSNGGFSQKDFSSVFLFLQEGHVFNRKVD